jgi:hypothetical protein
LIPWNQALSWHFLIQLDWETWSKIIQLSLCIQCKGLDNGIHTSKKMRRRIPILLSWLDYENKMKNCAVDFNQFSVSYQMIPLFCLIPRTQKLYEVLVYYKQQMEGYLPTWDWTLVPKIQRNHLENDGKRFYRFR